MVQVTRQGLSDPDQHDFATLLRDPQEGGLDPGMTVTVTAISIHRSMASVFTAKPGFTRRAFSALACSDSAAASPAPRPGWFSSHPRLVRPPPSTPWPVR